MPVGGCGVLGFNTWIVDKYVCGVNNKMMLVKEKRAKEVYLLI